MYRFFLQLRDLEWGIEKTRIFLSLLDGLIVFLAAAFLFLLLQIPVSWALLPASLFTLLRLLRGEDPLAAIERQYENLRIRLRTAYDNRDREGVVMDDLAENVNGMLKGVQFASFLDIRRLQLRIFLVTLLCFLIVSLAYVDVEPFDLQGFVRTELPERLSNGGGLGEGAGGLGGGEGGGAGTGEEGGIGEGAGVGGGLDEEVTIEQLTEDLFKEPSVAKLEGEELELQIHLGSGETRTRDVEETREFEASPQTFPVTPREAELYSDPIPEEHEEVVRRYFELLTEEAQ
jgi:hypothetical protein